MKLLSMTAVVLGAVFVVSNSADASSAGRGMAPPSFAMKSVAASRKPHGHKRHAHEARQLVASGMAGLTIAPLSIDEPELAGADRAPTLVATRRPECFRPMLISLRPARRAEPTPRLRYGAAPRC
jgi:hypothetical protein